MPIYEYVCMDCGNVFELIRPMSQADDLARCVACGGSKTARKLSRFFAESGGRSISGMSQATCGSCGGGNCARCGR